MPPARDYEGQLLPLEPATIPCRLARQDNQLADSKRGLHPKILPRMYNHVHSFITKEKHGHNDNHRSTRSRA